MSTRAPFAAGAVLIATAVVPSHPAKALDVVAVSHLENYTTPSSTKRAHSRYVGVTYQYVPPGLPNSIETYLDSTLYKKNGANWSQLHHVSSYSATGNPPAINTAWVCSGSTNCTQHNSYKHVIDFYAITLPGTWLALENFTSCQYLSSNHIADCNALFFYNT
jgi:hypothetical protein